MGLLIQASVHQHVATLSNGRNAVGSCAFWTAATHIQWQGHA